MKFFVVLLSVVSLSVSIELDSYKDYLVFAAKNHYKTVTDYANSIGVTQLDTQFNDFKVKFERKYSPEEEEERKFNFLKSLQFIESHNKLYESGDVTHEVGINQFSDWSSEEYNSMLLPKSVILTNLVNITKHIEPEFYAALPPTFDWRSENKVTPVKNQGQCGSCWAFSAVATIESAYAIRHNQDVSLSEQQLVDCDASNNGCNWGNVGQALEYVQMHGLESESAYPYMNRKQSCMNNAAKAHTRITGGYMLNHPATDDQIMSAIMNHGPVAVNIDASGNDFGQYRGGIISTGGQNMNHYVTAVGWGPGYWIIKNSWGTEWGEQGFGKMVRGKNIRGFNNWLFYPTV